MGVGNTNSDRTLQLSSKISSFCDCTQRTQNNLQTKKMTPSRESSIVDLHEVTVPIAPQ